MGYPDMMRDIMEQERQERIAGRRKALENRPIVDRMTGLYCREYFDLRLDEEMARSRLYANKLSMFFLDAGLCLRDDQGKENRIGERTMQVITKIITDCLGDTIGLAFLYDEFKVAVILPEADEQEAVLMADRIMNRIRMGPDQDIAPRTGIVQYKDHEHIDELVQAAQEALDGNIRG